MDEPSELTELEHAILEFEARPVAEGALKEAAIRSRFGLSPVRYYQKLNRLLDSPAALRHDPILIHRLQRLRDARLGARGYEPKTMGR